MMKRICASDQFTRATAAVETADPVDNGQQVARINRPAAVENAQQNRAVNAKAVVENAPLLADKLIDHGELKQGWWAVFVKVFAGWRERRQTVKILRGLSDSQLRDIGLSCRDVDQLYGERDDSRKVWPNWPK